MPLWQEGQDQVLSISRSFSGARPRPIQPGLREKAPRSGPGLLVAFRHLTLPRPEKTLPQHGPFTVFTRRVSVVLTAMERLRRGRACGALYSASPPSARPLPLGWGELSQRAGCGQLCCP